MRQPLTELELAAFWKGRRVAITGATGFVGHHLALQLQGFGARVIGLARDPRKAERLRAAGIACAAGALEDESSVRALAQDREFFFHVAGAVDFEGDWRRFHAVNVEGTRRALAAAFQAGVRRFIHTSSIVAVGAALTPRRLDETAAWNLGPLRVPYVTTKRQAEEAALAHGGDVVVVNPACVIGPDDFCQSEFGLLCKRFWRGRLAIHFGGGNNYIDVRDVARGHLLAAMFGQTGQRYLLAGTNRPALDFFRDLANVSPRGVARVRVPEFLAPVVAALNQRWRGKKGTRPYLTPGQAKLLPYYFYFDAGRATRELGFRPRPWGETLRDAHAFWMGADRRRAA